ncbi:PREDICTED: F-box protein DOR-like [Brassica oleracea var. oleracea]|uniref:F-box domain-containing protein n=1 Tax=Brassica oleracea var. oleracea TaxID=109376 RepID=A0A0D3C3K3_BRAOL|nr:PREDICTED: F-box protein DOR-like [Brassica oleracea var. oleracea]
MKQRKQNDSENGVNITRGITRSMTTRHRNSLTLPVEVVTEIFSRLPSKSIARCRCVCKLWSSMLRRQDFTELFLTKSCAHPRLLFACEDGNEQFLYEKKNDSEFLFFSSPQPHNPEENSYVVAVNNLACFPSSYQLFGCTCGFLCYGANLILKARKKRAYVTVICNPSTGQSLILPTLKSSKTSGIESYLGYDPVSKEFKVLSVRYDGWISKEHQVLTLGTKKLSWRLVECCVPHSTSRKWICISGVLYYIARTSEDYYMVVCFDLRTEKFSFVKFSRALPGSATLINYNGRLGLLMSLEDFGNVSRSSKSIELWVLGDAAKNEWSEHVYMLPDFWKDVVAESMCIAGMVGTHEIILSPCYQYVPSYVIYFHVESKTIRKVGIQGMEAFQGNRCYTYLNYVENVKLL